jgi:putative endonuclease
VGAVARFTWAARPIWRAGYFSTASGSSQGSPERTFVTRLVFAEPFASIAEAYAAEQRIKRWRRAWKIKLIEERNPLWRDLYEEINW